MSGLRFFLDTNTCIYIINKRPPHVMETFSRYTIGEIGVSSITVSELAYGVAQSGRASNRAGLDAFLTDLMSVPYDDDAAWAYGGLRATLQASGTPIGPLDTQIAAHALSAGVALVTNNVREFQRVPGLKVENWF